MVLIDLNLNIYNFYIYSVFSYILVLSTLSQGAFSFVGSICEIIWFKKLHLSYCFFVTIKVGIGGFNMGVVMALYSATCFAMEKYENGNLYNVNVRAVIGFSGWLPRSRYD